MKISVFLDTDVVISSIISDLGAAYLIINENLKVDKYVSDKSVLEIQRVAERLGLEKSKVMQVLGNFKLVRNTDTKKYRQYTFDNFDEPIINGVAEAKVKFLITYNLKHYDLEKIKRELDILVMPPGKFLQYLRSINHR